MVNEELLKKGLALISDALKHVTTTGECESESTLHGVKGDLLLSQSPPSHAEAEASFRKAFDVARRQSAKSFELRAATSLAG